MIHDKSIKISVIICTYNGKDRIPAAVDSIIRQSYNTDRYEVIIVDNKSEDDTRAVSEKIIAEASSVKIRYVFEENRGLSNARNRGVREARGEIIAFMDDDAIADRNWLLNMDGIFFDSSIHALGGRVLPIFEAPRPRWLNKTIEEALTILDLGDEFLRFEYPYTTPFGTNMAFRRMVFDAIGYFDSSLGREGNKLLSGEETDLFLRMDAKKFVCIYAPNCIVYHHVPVARLKKSFFRKRTFYQGRTTAYMSLKFNSFFKVLLRDFGLFFGKGKEIDDGKRRRRNLFCTEVKLIFYASYLLFLFVYALHPPHGANKSIAI